MSDFLHGLDLRSLPGPERGVSPALYYHDEIVLSPSGQHFALAYTIFEATNGNPVGHLLWGRMVGERAVVLENPKIHASCWSRPWTTWLDGQTFVFKAQRYDGKRTHIPLVVIDIEYGFAVVPATNHVATRPADVRSRPEAFISFTEDALIRELIG